MTEEVAKRAVACPKWKWMAGMLLLGQDQTYRLTYVWHGDIEEEDEEDEFHGLAPILQSGGHQNHPAWGWPAPESGWLPDLEDPATLGCLLAMVRDVWGDENAFVDRRGGWACCVSSKGPLHGHDLEFCGETEAEALVTALEESL